MNPQPTAPGFAQEIQYPDSDGQPLAENTVQFQWIVTIHSGLNAQFRAAPNVFVAGDLLWYPVQGDPATRVAPDVMVAFGRPKGDRGSYKQWVEGGIAPQVVFEILSPGNRTESFAGKMGFYERYGVEEYYIYDPEESELWGFLGSGGEFQNIREMAGWISPRLQIRFDLRDGDLFLFHPDGTPFRTALEQSELAERTAVAERQSLILRQETEQAWKDAEQARHDATQARQDALSAAQRSERLAAQLRALGIEPE